MSLLSKTRSMLPSQASDLFNTGLRFPDLFDFERDLFNLESKANLIPNANVIEHDKEFRIELAVPGLDRKDFKVEVDKGVLTVSAEKEEEKKEDSRNFKRREFSYSSFRRSFTLPENAIEDKIEAKYENGILQLSLPKKEMTITKSAKEIKVS